jgi:hypothetical protein
MNLVWKLLRKHISIIQLGGFFVANLIGLGIILCGVQIYNDVKPLLSGENSLLMGDNIVIAKQVKMMKKDTSFTPSEISEIEAQPFVRNVGQFTAAQYEVYGGINFMGQGISTMLFFESVPDEFLDVTSEKWGFEQGDSIIPIIIPRTYLDLYNFGFSNTQDMPKLTENTLKSAVFDMRLRGNGQTIYMSANIVGFSDKLNTILVPESFIRWSNSTLADIEECAPSRLIIEVDNPTDEAIAKFLKEKSYIPEESGDNNSKIAFLLKIAVAVVVIIGSIFCVLSVFILTLSIYLLLQKNTSKLENLALIGYPPLRIARPYIGLVAGLNGAILLGALLVTAIVRSKYMALLGEMFTELSTSGMTWAVITGVVATLVIIAFNIGIILRQINAIARKR